MGRRKVEMKEITKNSSRQVTFSKRKAGLFKKANEISTLFAAEMAIIAFSPGGKPFSYGNPNVDSAMSRTLYEASMLERHEQWMVHYGCEYKDIAEKERRFKIYNI